MPIPLTVCRPSQPISWIATAPADHGARLQRHRRNHDSVEKSRGSRVITMIHRQEKRSLFGFTVSRHIDLEDAQTIIAVVVALVSNGSGARLVGAALRRQICRRNRCSARDFHLGPRPCENVHGLC
jgi:Serine dehydrogenase proteinase